MSKLEGRGADVSSGEWRTAISKLELELGTRGAEFFNLLNNSPKFCRSFAKSAIEIIDADGVKREQRAVSRPAPLIHGYFVPTNVQVENIKKWNKKFDWGITDEQFASLPAAPVWPTDKLTAVMLVYYPQQREEMTAVQSMFEGWWNVLKSCHKNKWRWDQILTDSDHLRFLEGCEVSPNTLRWEIIDLAAHWNQKSGMKPADKVGKGSASFGVLAAAAHHKKWVQSIDGTNVPLPTLGGLQLTVPGSDAWTNLPYLRWRRGVRQFRLHAHYASCQDGSWSVPSFRE